jgi:hypothetical protein
MQKCALETKQEVCKKKMKKGTRMKMINKTELPAKIIFNFFATHLLFSQ